MKREVPIIITTIAGLVFAVSYFIPHMPFGNAEAIFGDWVTIVQSFAVWLGVLSLTHISLQSISRRREGWQYAIITLVALYAVVGFGLYDGFSGLQATTKYGYNDAGTTFNWFYRFLYDPLSSTMFSILAFFVASASYRAFRARNLEATMLLVAAFFVMGGRVPLLDLAISPFTDRTLFSDFADWIMSYPNTAGQRAIMIGIALGIMSSSLRVILGIERSHIGGES